MCAALEQLGYTPHHMRSCMKNPQSLRYWSEAARIRYFDAPGAPYGRDEFDKLLGEHDVGFRLPHCGSISLTSSTKIAS